MVASTMRTPNRVKFVGNAQIETKLTSAPVGSKATAGDKLSSLRSKAKNKNST